MTEEGEQPLDVDLMDRAFGNKTEDRTSLGYTGTQTKSIFRSNQFEEDFDFESCRFEENANIILTVSSEQDSSGSTLNNMRTFLFNNNLLPQGDYIFMHCESFMEDNESLLSYGLDKFPIVRVLLEMVSGED